MERLECPNCHQKTIPVWRKMLLGLGSWITCTNCHTRLYVGSWTIYAVLVPAMIAFVVAQQVGSIVIARVVALVAILAITWIFYKLPLIVKK